jgi:hypothetical protein
MRFTAAVVFHRERILLMIRHSADPQTKEHTSGAGGPSFPAMSAANWRQILQSNAAIATGNQNNSRIRFIPGEHKLRGVRHTRKVRF